MGDAAKKIKKTLDVTAPVIDEGTVLKITVGLDPEKQYTYVALYVAGTWYLTGVREGLLNTAYQTTVDLMKHIARYPGAKVDIALMWETVR